MSRYRVIHCQIWNDDKFPFVSDDCQLVFFHLLSTPMSTPFGCYKASLEALSAEKRWPVGRYTKAFREAFAKGFVKYDERHLVIFIPHFITYNPPNNPNVLKAWGKVFAELPPSALKDECYQGLAMCAEAFGEAFHKAFHEGFAKASPKLSVPVPVPDTDPRREQSAERKHHVALTNGHARGMTAAELVQGWNDICGSEGLPRKLKVTDGLRKKLEARMSTYPREAFWEAVINWIANNRRYHGDNKTGWRCTLHWLVANDEHPLSVYEEIPHGTEQRLEALGPDELRPRATAAAR